MRKMKALLIMLFTASLFLVTSPSAQALSLAPGFNSPVTLTLYPGGGITHLLCTAPAANIKAVVENLSPTGMVVGPYYFNVSGPGQLYMGQMSGNAAVQEIGFHYWDGSAGNALLYLSSAGADVPITVRVTFYKVN